MARFDFKSTGAALGRGMYARLLEIDQARRQQMLDGIALEDRQRLIARQEAEARRQASLDQQRENEQLRSIAIQDRNYADQQARQAVLDQRYETEQRQGAMDRADVVGNRYLDSERDRIAAEQAAEARQRERAEDRAHALRVVNAQMGGRAANERPTQGQLTADTFYARATDALAEIEDVEDSVSQFNRYVPNFLQSEAGQAYQQAKRQFVEAYLRKDSGAAIGADEYRNADLTYFVQPGDSAATVQRKRDARRRLAETIRSQGSERGSGNTGRGGGGNRPATFGEMRIINGVRARWDGRGWIAVAQ